MAEEQPEQEVRRHFKLPRQRGQSEVRAVVHILLSQLLPVPVSSEGKGGTGNWGVPSCRRAVLGFAANLPAGFAVSAPAELSEETPAEPTSILLEMEPSRGNREVFFESARLYGFCVSWCSRSFSLMDLWDLQIPGFKGSCGFFPYFSEDTFLAPPVVRGGGCSVLGKVLLASK